MGTRPDRMKVSELISSVNEGVFDVLEFQRMFNRDRAWVRDLIDSLVRGIPVNSLLLWDTAGGPAVAGRYRASSGAQWWIVDGQQRVTAILAALGVQPSWMPDDRWASTGGNQLSVVLATDRHRHVMVADRGHRGPQVSLADLYARDREKELRSLLTSAGFRTDDQLILEFHELLMKILSTELLMEWMPGDLDDAFLAFTRHNSRATQLSLKTDELELSALAIRFGPLLREYVDPALDDAARSQLAKTITRRRLNKVLQRMLPPDRRKLNAAKAEPEDVQVAAEQIRNACAATVRYLHEHGLVHDELVTTPAVAEVLMALFAHMPRAADDTFPLRWIAHVVAGNLFFGRPAALRYTLDAVFSGTPYDQIQAMMAAQLPAGLPSPFTEERLHPTPKKKTSFGPNGCLFALASANPPGQMTDLADRDRLYPDPGMRLRPLCEDPETGLLVHYTFMTDRAAEIIASNGGWTRQAAEELKPDGDSLEAHCLLVPPRDLGSRHVGAWLQENRTPKLSRRIETFLNHTGALRDAPDPPLEPLAG